jgi:hypothetical protein
MFGTGVAVRSTKAMQMGLVDATFTNEAGLYVGAGRVDAGHSVTSSDGGTAGGATSAAAAVAGVQFLQPFVSAGEPHVLREIKRMCKAVQRGAEEGNGAGTTESDIFCGLWGGPANLRAIAKQKKIRQRGQK